MSLDLFSIIFNTAFFGGTVMADLAMEDLVKEALEMFRPQLQAEGGDLEYVCIDEQNRVHLNLVGACIGCPMAFMTLKMGIEQYLKDACPQVTEVIQDNASPMDEGMEF